MSTVRAATLSNLSGTGSPAITGGELSRARFNLNGTGTIAARDSFNIASFTDNGAGDYTATFSTAFPNALYSVLGSTAIAAGVLFFYPADITTVRTVSAARVRSLNTSYSAADVDDIDGAFFGDIP